MSGIMLLIGAIILFLIAYTAYGGWLAKQWGLDIKRETPAHTMYDGIDYAPAKAPVLLGHHFASIAGAGPINGPIQAAVFGWVPVALWIVIGSIFFGAAHDFGSLIASLRHKGKSIGDIIEVNVGMTGKRLFLLFSWLTLVLIVAAFANIVADTFVSTPQAATASLLFIPLAVAFGFAVYRRNASLTVSTVIGVIILALCIVIGYYAPLSLAKTTWIFILSIYIIAASVMPVWILLQPRDYLNSFLLYGMMIGGIVGILLYNPNIQLPAFTSFKVGTQYLFPMLFVTVACGAISGFHSLVASGTTAKQLDREGDAKLIGYGSMLIEGVLATIAIITAAYLAKDKFAALMKGGPTNVFADGLGTFMTSFGLNFTIGKTFAALAVSAFAMTTLDTATRLGRFAFQEFFENISEAGEKGHVGSPAAKFFGDRFVASLITVAASVILAFTSWKVIWPIFGAANQLLAAIALLAVAAWLANAGKNNSMLIIPMIFMFAVTLTALGFLIKANAATGNYLLVVFAVLLFILAILLIIQTYGVLTGKNKKTTVGM
ncbi:carbon starvation protein A [Biomaibacter acetigenes]|uniref:Carbon starvation protein A n=1 Tax=Biomaibacter acetigenes TaxID=2316383 RepID=A0A3G2R254_9FIRM|nr:carbon starvation protein A [Biomaibacter acetigenes]AYO29533.1 carbon starvation protein A [Biomaibacter acetigenes]MDN5301374.1 carbon starvation protein [Thermoanaerobacteraceae bacterium]MDN5313670.1 carbon starvation protein [Thermoanaerobacteraceae bacterium]RKL61914.1 carbon starvation protein A [Thermoanaerobacteraceae bacterium SP2]